MALRCGDVKELTWSSLMAICSIIGDSIALGLSLVHPGCDVQAKVGRSSQAISHYVPRGHRDWVVISAGTNDWQSPSLARNLEKIRTQVSARRVLWIVPLIDQRAAAAVRRQAGRRGDQVQSFTSSPDHKHPHSYQKLWKMVEKKL